MAAKKAKPKVTLPSEYIKFIFVFSKEATDHVPPSWPYDHEINLDESFVPKIGKIYPLSPDEQKATEDFLDENLRSGTICPSNSSQAFPFFFVKKKDGNLRPCQDYQYLNEHTICDTYPLSLISDLIDKLQDVKFDVQWGYNNVHIKDRHQWKAAFVTHKGLFEPTVMFFDLTNSPATFQHFMNDSFWDMIAEGWLVIYMDNLLIFSLNDATHTEWTKGVLQQMKELDLHLKLEKCNFASSEVKYLGMIIKPGELAMDPIKLDGIAQWPVFTKVKDVWSFLGFANFYRQFIPDYFNIAHPLIDLIKKNLAWNWTPQCQSAFNSLKSLFLSKPILCLPDLSSPFAITTNASKFASGAMLLQTDVNGEWHPCSYVSLPIILLHQKELQYLWQETPCNHPSPKILEAMPSWFSILHPDLHWSQKSHILLQSPISESKTSLLAFGPCWLWPQNGPCPWQTPHCTRCSLQTPWSTPPWWWQWGCNTTSPLNVCLCHWCCSLPSYYLCILWWPPCPPGTPIYEWGHSSCLLLLPLWLADHWRCSNLQGPYLHTWQWQPLLHHLTLPPQPWTAGHPDFLKTCQLVAAEFWWPSLVSYVWKYVEGCATC